MKFVDRLETHIALGDYNYIFNERDPKIVAFYFKSVLKYMEEPLCTYKHYSKFKDLCLLLANKENESTFIS